MSGILHLWYRMFWIHCPLKAWLFYTKKNSTYRPQSVLLCCVWFSEQTAIFYLHSVKLSHLWHRQCVFAVR